MTTIRELYIPCGRCGIRRQKQQFDQSQIDLFRNDKYCECTPCINDKAMRAAIEEGTFVGNKPSDYTHLVACNYSNSWLPCTLLCQMDKGTNVFIYIINKNMLVSNDLTIPYDSEQQYRAHRKPMVTIPFDEPKVDENKDKEQSPKQLTDDEALTLMKAAAESLNIPLSQYIHDMTHKPVSNDNNDNYTHLLYQETQIKTFTAKYPTDEKSFYNYSNEIEVYKNDHSTIPESRIFNSIMDKVPKPAKRAWKQHKNALFGAFSHKYLIEHEQLAALPVLRQNTLVNKAFQKEMNCIEQFERFIMSNLHINPTIHYFQQQLGFVYPLRSESPVDLYHRVIQYYLQIDIIREKINPLLHREIRVFDEREKIEDFQKILLLRNNQSEYNNNTFLNKKVKNYCAKWFDNTAEQTLAKLLKHLIKIEKEILPQSMVNMDIEGQHWNQRPLNLTIFNIRPNKKRKHSDDTPGQPPLKKMKTKQGAKPKGNTPRCTNGAKCKFYLKNKKCRFIHTKEELNEMKKTFKSFKTRNSSHSTDSDSRSIPYSAQSRWDKPSKNTCQRGVNCNLFQYGKCWYKHDLNIMQCSCCKKMEHPELLCKRRKSSNNTNENGPDHYNPSSPKGKVNHSFNDFKEYQKFQKMMAIYHCDTDNNDHNTNNPRRTNNDNDTPKPNYSTGKSPGDPAINVHDYDTQKAFLRFQLTNANVAYNAYKKLGPPLKKKPPIGRQ